jgi:hypothetical protein
MQSVFGACFSTHGLGGVLTCGTIGIMAGLSHSPVMGGKEQVSMLFRIQAVAFSFSYSGFYSWASISFFLFSRYYQALLICPLSTIRTQYVFFSFPHISIDSLASIGKISRPNRPGSSSACGALCAVSWN